MAEAFDRDILELEDNLPVFWKDQRIHWTRILQVAKDLTMEEDSSAQPTLSPAYRVPRNRNPIAYGLSSDGCSQRQPWIKV
jgi:hypothetical protein